MATFRNLQELFKHLEKQVNSTLKEDVAPKVVEQLVDNIDKTVYDAYDPVSYERTYELRDSVDSQVLQDTDKTIILEVFNNVEYIKPYPEGQHTSWVDGSDQSSHIPEWTALGHKGLFHMGKRDYFEVTREELKQSGKHVTLLRRGLSKRGIKIK